MSGSPKSQPIRYSQAARARATARAAERRRASERARRERRAAELRAARHRLTASAGVVGTTGTVDVANAVAALRSAGPAVASSGDVGALPSRVVPSGAMAAAAPAIAAADAQIEAALASGDAAVLDEAVTRAHEVADAVAAATDAAVERQTLLEDAADMVVAGLADRFAVQARRYDDDHGVLLAAVSERFGSLRIVVTDAEDGEEDDVRILTSFDGAERPCEGLVEILEHLGDRLKPQGAFSGAISDGQGRTYRSTRAASGARSTS